MKLTVVLLFSAVLLLSTAFAKAVSSNANVHPTMQKLEKANLVWGVTGHKMISRIAEGLLTSLAREKIDYQLAPGVTLERISTLPDDYRPKAPWSAPWHYVNQPSTAANFSILPVCEPGGCVVTAILNYTSRLIEERNAPPKDGCVASTAQEPCTLAWLTHFVGDVHQPMHVGFASDKGGNDFDLSFFNSTANLHSTWDTGILNRYLQQHGVSYNEAADNIVVEMRKDTKTRHLIESSLRPTDWANVSYEYVRAVCYNFFPGSVNPWGTYNPSSSSTAQTEDGMLLGARVWQLVDRAMTNLKDTKRRNGESVESQFFEFQNNNGAAPACGPYAEQPYQDRAAPVVMARLTEAGVRLASYFNCIYDSKADCAYRLNGTITKNLW